MVLLGADVRRLPRAGAGRASGLSCFLLPRVLPDGSRNAFHIQRLKDKLGNRSNASSEIELHGAWARMVGEEGRGVPTIIEMVGHTRLDCVIGSAAGMRAGVVAGHHHAAHRSAFGKKLIDQPLMRNVLADLCVESEAATALAMRLARAYDEAGAEARRRQRRLSDAHLFKRLATAVGKYWMCKRAPNHAFEALECLGGNGYVEESGMPRLYREAPLDSIWEGSGNVMSLDVLRAMAREPALAGGLPSTRSSRRTAPTRAWTRASPSSRASSRAATLETRARRVVERWRCACRARCSCATAPRPSPTPSAPRASAATAGLEYGTLPAGSDFEAIIARAAGRAQQ